jgi:hypothetical protein
MAKTIYIDQSVIPKDKKWTFLSDNVTAGAVTFGFQSSLGLVSLSTSSGQILMFGELGQEKTEVIKIASTGTGTNIGGTSATLATGLRFDHPLDTKIYFLDWDRYEVQWAATVTGSKATLMAYPEYLQPDQLEAIYRDTTESSGFYFARFNSTIDGSSSDWSDPIPYGGFNDNSVFEIKRRAIESINETVDGVIISDEMLNRWLWELRREYHNMPGKRPFRKKFNMAIGNVLTGSYYIDLPADVEHPFTAENVFGVRAGTNENMEYIDKKEWDFYYVDKPHSTLELPYTVGVSTSIWLANGRDFSASATIGVEGTAIGLSRITGSYNSFNIITHGSWSCSGGSDAWENITLGMPDEFTVWENINGSAFIYFNRPFDTVYVNQNIYCDYYAKVVELQTDYDALDEPFYDMFVSGLAWKVKKRKSPDLNLLQDPDYILWQTLKQQAHDREFEGQWVHLMPDIKHLM